LNWEWRDSQNGYGFFGVGCDAFTMFCEGFAFRACILTPLPSATALMMSVKLPLSGLCIFCGLLILISICGSTCHFHSLIEKIRYA